MLYVSNAFSLNMLDGQPCHVHVRPVTVSVAQKYIDSFAAKGKIVSAIGHKDTAVLTSALLNRDIPDNRINVKLEADKDLLLVAQYTGPRLQEGTINLPEGAEMKFYMVSVDKEK